MPTPLPNEDSSLLIIKDANGDQRELKVLDESSEYVIYTALTGGIAERLTFNGTTAGVDTKLLVDATSSTGLSIAPAAGSVFTVTASTSNPVAVTFSAESPLAVTSSGNGVPVTIKNASLTVAGTLTGITNAVTVTASSANPVFVTGSPASPLPISYGTDLYTDTVESKKRLIVKAEGVAVTVTDASVDYKDSYYASTTVTTESVDNITNSQINETLDADQDTKNLIILNLTNKDLLVYVGQTSIPAFLLVSSASYECNPVDSKLSHTIKTRGVETATGDVYITRTKV